MAKVVPHPVTFCKAWIAGCVYTLSRRATVLLLTLIAVEAKSQLKTRSEGARLDVGCYVISAYRKFRAPKAGIFVRFV